MNPVQVIAIKNRCEIVDYTIIIQIIQIATDRQMVVLRLLPSRLMFTTFTAMGEISVVFVLWIC